MKQKLPERRRFIRIDKPLKVKLLYDGESHDVVTKNISPVGLRFENPCKFDEDKKLDFELYIPSLDAPVHLRGRVVWQAKISLEDNSPFDVGVEITSIEDNDKNGFLKYLCNLLYSTTFHVRT